jgi:hypothetical protein
MGRKSCKHRNGVGYRWLSVAGWWAPITRFADFNLRRVDWLDRVTCDDCGTWLPLGPSNDRGRPVSIEMRAARIASKWAPLDYECLAVRDGWYCHRDGLGPRFDNVYGQAGYLAHAIATHKEAK